MGEPMVSNLQLQEQGQLSFPGLFRLSEPRIQVQYGVQMQPHDHLNVQRQSPKPEGAGVTFPAAPMASSGGPKRARHRPPSKASGGASNANVASQFKSMELAPAPWRKKPKHAENKQLPENVAALLPQSAVYAQLLELEARVDALMARKKEDIQESIQNPSLVRKTMRLYVFNTCENQDQGIHESNDFKPPSWSLKIIGRILEDGKDPVLSGMVQKQYPEFSSFLKKITIYLDQSLYPNNHVILWENARSPVLREGFEVKRKGNREFTARIRLEINYTPEKFKLSTALSEVLGVDTESRPKILVAIWQYIKSKKLQIPGDPSFFTCDARLQKIFGEENMKFSMVSQKINPHLTSPPPIHLEHRITLSGNCPSGTTCYDIPVDVPVPLKKDLADFLARTERKKEIGAFDEHICDTISKINDHHRKRAFFLRFSQSPAAFINSLIASQSNDLKLVDSDASHILESETRNDFYNQQWLDDAVVRYLDRKSAGNNASATT